jgi:hypothetical protein
LGIGTREQRAFYVKLAYRAVTAGRLIRTDRRLG